MKTYEFLDDITWADVAFKAYGKTIEELFNNAACATTEAMVARMSVKAIQKKEVTLIEDTYEKLLYSFLEHIVVIKDSDQYFLHDCSVSIKKSGDNWHCVATFLGDTIKPNEQRLHNDVKAVTYHAFTLEQKNDEWIAIVVLDV